MKRGTILLMSLFVIVLGSIVFSGDFDKGSPMNNKPEMMDEGDAPRNPWMKDDKDRECMRQKRQGEFMKQLTKDLNLSKDQETSIKQILDDGWKQMEQEKKAMMERMKALHDQNDEKIKIVLNDKQKQLFEEKKKEMREKIEQKMDKKHKKFDKKKKMKQCQGTECSSSMGCGDTVKGPDIK
jgi:hypothetical protein